MIAGSGGFTQNVCLAFASLFYIIFSNDLTPLGTDIFVQVQLNFPFVLLKYIIA